MARDEYRSDRDLIEEVASRARRTETRVTLIANHLGVDPGGTKPMFDPETQTLHVPNPRVALEEVLAAAGDHAKVPIYVYCGTALLMTFTV